MARNEEKAQAMLNRFVTAKKDANREDKSQRPYLSSECTNVRDCEMYRSQIIKEISKKVSLIQNEGLEEHRVRDLNDSINKLMREKGHWERQIKTLGGPDYFKLAPRLGLDDDAAEVVPGKGYRYYGAAKRLPGVRELFKKAPPERAKRTRFEIFKTIDADYYGYRDDDDGVLVKLEAEAEAGLLAKGTDEWESSKAARREANPQLADEVEDEEAAQFVAHVAVPDEAAVRQAILARRKQELLANLDAEASGAGKKQKAKQKVEAADLASIKRLPPSW